MRADDGVALSAMCSEGQMVDDLEVARFLHLLIDACFSLHSLKRQAKRTRIILFLLSLFPSLLLFGNSEVLQNN